MMIRLLAQLLSGWMLLGTLLSPWRPVDKVVEIESLSLLFAAPKKALPMLYMFTSEATSLSRLKFAIAMLCLVSSETAKHTFQSHFQYRFQTYVLLL
jgi:hypothetical protein